MKMKIFPPNTPDVILPILLYWPMPSQEYVGGISADFRTSMVQIVS